ncbi:MAG: UvrB/UvrC motif-containing protein [Clostridia bacterium]|nr:UvrB/UvrC motif-containing protein [Clostridia bacterium]
MKCQKCNAAEATAYIKQNINGKVTEMHLCSDCAASLGYQGFHNVVNPFEIFSSVFSPERKSVSSAKRCSKCNISFAEIVKTGRVGCPDCYTEFGQELDPTIKKIHGNAKHLNNTHTTLQSDEPTIEQLQNELQKAVEEQNYEQAAVLRDKIKERQAE